MTQPPYPPPGGNEPGGDQTGSSGWTPQGGADDPTRQFDSPTTGAQRDQTQQFGQPGQYGQPPHGQPPYGQPPYGQPQYGQQPGQPAYGQPPYGQPQYGQPQYGQPPYGQQPGQPPYGQPQYGQPWGAPGGPGGQPPKSNKNTVIALVVAAVVILAAIGAGLFFLLRESGTGTDTATSATSSSAPASAPSSAPSSEAESSSPSEPPSSAPAPTTDAGGIPPATVTPDDLGDDPVLDELAQQCYDGDMEACDSLYAQSEADSLYELYGGTCAGRQDVSVSDTDFCTNTFPGN